MQWPLPHLAQALLKQGGCRGGGGCSDGGVPVHPGAPESTYGPTELGALPQPLGSNDLRVFPLAQQPVCPHFSLALEAEVSKLDPAHPWSCFLGVIPSIEGNKGSKPQPTSPSHSPVVGGAGTAPASLCPHLHLYIATQLQLKAAKFIQDFFGGR